MIDGARPSGRLRLCLFVAGHGPNSLAARANLRAFLDGRGVEADLEVVDVLSQPERGLGAGVLITPMLLRISPSPELRIAGSLTDAAVLELLLDQGDR